jgi:RNA polymerase sigma-70 factor (ECF subfamily)
MSQPQEAPTAQPPPAAIHPAAASASAVATVRAIAALAERELPRLRQIARRILRNPEDAADVVQEALLQALRAAPRFEHRARIRTWLHRIVVNAALMHLRARRRERELPVAIGDDADDFRSALEAVPDPAPGAELELLRREEDEAVRRAVSRLAPAHRQVIELRELGDLSVSETAARLGVTANAVKIRHHRARRALSATLGAA